MPSTYTQSLRLEKQGTGENSGTWGVKLNNADFDLTDAAIAGVVILDCTTGTDITLTVANGATDEARKAVLQLVGTPVSNINIIVPTVTKTYDVDATALLGNRTVTVKMAAGSGVAFTAGSSGRVYSDGTDVKATINTNTLVPLSRQVIAGVGLSGGGFLSADVTLNIANTSVSAGTYGTSTSTSQFTVNPQGQITSAVNVPITLPPFNNMQVFTSSGTFTVPTGVSKVFVEVYGAGGGGGGGNDAGAGGGSGAYASGFVTVAATSAHPVSVGTGGSGGASSGATGADGTSSNFTGSSVVVAAGGGVGGPGANGQLSRNGGAGGTATNGSSFININGQQGGANFAVAGTPSMAGTGGNAPRGGGGGEPVSPNTVGAGSDGTVPGGGGSGANGVSNPRAGGAGANGMVVVYYP